MNTHRNLAIIFLIVMVGCEKQNKNITADIKQYFGQFYAAITPKLLMLS